MSLISGKEALIAWYDGYDVEIKHENTGWYLFNDHNFGITVFKSKDHEFRIKPRTITLNGIEVPAPFKPKEGERYFYLNPQADAGYGSNTTVKWSKYMQFGVWHTEDEIKQVVEALRSIFKA